VRAINPTHPGFGGTSRPESLHAIRGLAALYVALVDALDLADVTIVGNSVGGWIAVEVALLGSPRISSAILIDAVGIEVPGHPVADFFSLSMDQVFALAFHNPERFRVDPITLPPAAQAIVAGNRAALATCAGTGMSDPTLLARLSTLEMATLVLWGESDRTPTRSMDACTQLPFLCPASSCSRKQVTAVLGVVGVLSLNQQPAAISVRSWRSWCRRSPRSPGSPGPVSPSGAGACHLHSCHLIEIGGRTFLIDPWFSTKPGYYPGAPLAFSVADLPPLDGVLVSHATGRARTSRLTAFRSSDPVFPAKSR
jgi:hypothetical protein